jgi:hypothetical protein
MYNSGVNVTIRCSCLTESNKKSARFQVLLTILPCDAVTLGKLTRSFEGPLYLHLQDSTVKEKLPLDPEDKDITIFRNVWRIRLQL